jgi:hypothetical protein
VLGKNIKIPGVRLWLYPPARFERGMEIAKVKAGSMFRD